MCSSACWLLDWDWVCCVLAIWLSSACCSGVTGLEGVFAVCVCRFGSVAGCAVLPFKAAAMASLYGSAEATEGMASAAMATAAAIRLRRDICGSWGVVRTSRSLRSGRARVVSLRDARCVKCATLSGDAVADPCRHSGGDPRDPQARRRRPAIAPPERRRHHRQGTRAPGPAPLRTVIGNPLRPRRPPDPAPPGRIRRSGRPRPLTQEELANLAGTSRSTVNRVARDAQARGELALRRGRVEVIDPAALA